MSYEVVIPTRGDARIALTGLIPAAHEQPFPVRLVTHTDPAGPELLRTLAQLGCQVTVQYVPELRIGAARAAALTSRAPVVVSLDDDAVLVGHPEKLAAALYDGERAWAMPVLRQTANHYRPDPEADMPEWWLPVGTDTLEEAGIPHDLWRTYDTGMLHLSTSLVGVAFAVSSIAVAPLLPKLEAWGVMAREDSWLGQRLGPGVGVPDVFAYHIGEHANRGDAEVGRTLAATDLEKYRDVAAVPYFFKHFPQRPQGADQ